MRSTPNTQLELELIELGLRTTVTANANSSELIKRTLDLATNRAECHLSSWRLKDLPDRAARTNTQHTQHTEQTQIQMTQKPTLRAEVYARMSESQRVNA
jgi:hypothetical protein